MHLGAVLLAMVPAAYAHMILSNPKPYGKPTSSPLKPDGSDFPCQNVEYTVNTMNHYKAGEQGINLEFDGGAAHMGGSCQLALSTNMTPNKSDTWKVIYSIEGGCPLSAIPFTIPKEVPNGEFSMAVTWFNHIGNREMYMNCAPVTISGGSNDSAAFDKLPDLALANIAFGEGANCKTTEGFDYTFDNPGQYSTRIGPGPFKPLCGGETVPGQPGQPGQPSVKPPNDGKYTPPAIQAPAPPQSPGVVTSTVRTLVTVTATGKPTSSTPAATTSQTGGAREPSATTAPQPTGLPSTPGGSANGNTCATDGALLCNGDTQFGLCNHGTIVWQAVAPGTKCVNGEITRAKRDYTHRNQRSAI
ncbi:uncharacterized protein EI97DRAFT_428292 [Westerdykella ornata]|uniref:Carbohydrate-binding module family 19 domain-containing protein n=1 Tax=Westerdykella ornata TaxID=318751 RepID=A0A6A6J5I6_WESOR|nr:uncharacterized protein EI97DRAFT_428292 [Westerdykella ornata]KAF2271403.1 hypothetical protein EI97DRAFT_428292 [Westerdykella ornata]